MIRILSNDRSIFESKCQAIVNPINCIGVMGKGLALEFKKRFPDMFEDYVDRCSKGKVKIGEPYLYVPNNPNSRLIVCFPTKDDWRKPSQMKYIIDGILYFIDHYKKWGLKSVAFPALGAGLGGLDPYMVMRFLLRKLPKEDLDIELYLPRQTVYKRPAMICIAGAQCSGKTSLATLLMQEFKNPAFVKFAGPIYAAIDSLGREKNREFMQRFGDAARECYGYDVFNIKFQDRVLQYLQDETYDLIVCDDVRFPDELELCEKLGFTSVFVDAPEYVRRIRSDKLGLCFKPDHESESYIDKLKYKCVLLVKNSGSINELVDAAKGLKKICKRR